MTKKISIIIAYLIGIGLIFIGARFLLAPETAEVGYGLHFREQGDYSFHYIKGIRDAFCGLLICVLLLSRQFKALGLALLVSIIIPTTDMIIVLSKEYNGFAAAIPHLSAIILGLVLGILFLSNKSITKVQ